MYRCLICKRIVKKIEDRVICPYCGSRILIKVRPRIIKRVRAR